LATNVFAAQEITPCKKDLSGEIKCGKSSIFNLDTGKYTLPAILAAGAIDGINPCAIGLIILLLGYLIIFAKRPDLVPKLSSVYIITIFVTYFLIGLFFYKFISFLVALPYYHEISRIIRYGIGGALAIAGLINIKDFFWYGKGVSLSVPESKKWKLTHYVQKTTVPATIFLGLMVTLFELPCSLPLYVGAVGIMHDNLGIVNAISYLLLYNVMFVMPLLVIFILILFGKRIAELKEWQESKQRVMKLGMGLALEAFALFLFLIK
jgi:cytochrome c biogenesis protein CcdA